MFLLRIYLLFPPPNLASIEFTSLTRDTNRFVCESTVFFLLLSDVRFKPFLPIPSNSRSRRLPLPIERLANVYLGRFVGKRGPSLLGNIVYRLLLLVYIRRESFSFVSSKSRIKRGSKMGEGTR